MSLEIQTQMKYAIARIETMEKELLAMPSMFRLQAEALVEREYLVLLEDVKAATHVISGDLAESWEITRHDMTIPEGFVLERSITSNLPYAETEITRPGHKMEGTVDLGPHDPFKIVGTRTRLENLARRLRIMAAKDMEAVALGERVTMDTVTEVFSSVEPVARPTFFRRTVNMFKRFFHRGG